MLSRVSLRQLQYFAATGRAGSITAASAALHISASSISAAVVHLESEFAVSLFKRQHAQGLLLTEAGYQVLEEVEEILRRVDRLTAGARTTSKGFRSHVRVGVFSTFAPLVVPELLRTFGAAHPATGITQVEDHQPGLLAKLQRSEIDVALTYDLATNNLPEGYAFEPLAALPAHVIVSERHALARRSEIALEELTSVPMVLLDLPISRDYFFSIYSAAGIEPPDVHTRSSSMDVVRSMVASDMGYSLANIRPHAAVAANGLPLKRIPLAGTHRPMMVGLLTPGYSKLSNAAIAFCAHCRALITEESIPGMAAS